MDRIECWSESETTGPRSLNRMIREENLIRFLIKISPNWDLRVIHHSPIVSAFVWLPHIVTSECEISKWIWEKAFNHRIASHATRFSLSNTLDIAQQKPIYNDLLIVLQPRQKVIL